MTKKTSKQSESLLDFFDEVDPQAVKDEENSGGNKVEFCDALKKPVKNHPIRILPPLKGNNKPIVKVWTHFIRIPGVDGLVVFNCRGKDDCPGCELSNKLIHSKNAATAKLGESFKASSQYYAYVIDRKNEEAGIQPMRLKYSQVEKINEWLKDEDDEDLRNICHPIKGRDLRFSRKGTGRHDTKYTVDLNPKGPSPVVKNVAALKEMLEDIPEEGLKAFTSVMDADKIRKILAEKFGANLATLGIKAAPKSKAKAITGNVVDIDDIDDDDLDDFDLDDDDEDEDLLADDPF